MKSFIAVVIIFSVILTLVIANAFFVSSSLSRLSDLSFEMISDEEHKSNVKNIITAWQKSRYLLSFSIEADEIERMNDIIEALRTADQTNNSFEISKCCRLIIDLANELIEYEQISVESIL